MSTKLNCNNGSRSIVPEGTHSGCLDQIDDLGLQPGFENGLPKYKRAYRFHISANIAEGNLAGQPHRISDIIVDSMHEKSTMRKLVHALRGCDLTADELRSVSMDFDTIVKRTCLLTIRHKPGKDGLRAVIESYAQLPQGMQPLAWSPERETPEWIRQMQARRLDKQEPSKPSTPPPVETRDVAPPAEPAAATDTCGW